MTNILGLKYKLVNSGALGTLGIRLPLHRLIKGLNHEPRGSSQGRVDGRRHDEWKGSQPDKRVDGR